MRFVRNDQRTKGVGLAVGLAVLLGGLLGACGDDASACPDETGVACRYIGTGDLGLNGDGHPARETKLYWVVDLEFAADGTPYVLDWNNHMVRRINEDGTVETIIGNFVGDGDPEMKDLTPEGAPGLEVRLNHPTDIQFDSDGTLILCAWHNHKLRVWNPETGMVHVTAGRGAGYAGDGSTLEEALFNQPKNLVLAEDGTMYLLDQRNHRVRAVAPDGTVSTVAGTGTPGYGGDGGPAVEAQLELEAGSNPEPSGGLALGDGVLYIADGLNHRIRTVDLSTGIIETIAGTGAPGYGGDGGPAVDAQLQHPRDLEVGPDGRLYVADTENHRIRAIDLDAGTIETVAGTGEVGMGTEGELAVETMLNRPMGVAFGPENAMYVADTYNSRVLRVPL